MAYSDEGADISAHLTLDLWHMEQQQSSFSVMTPSHNNLLLVHRPVLSDTLAEAILNLSID